MFVYFTFVFITIFYSLYYIYFPEKMSDFSRKVMQVLIILYIYAILGATLLGRTVMSHRILKLQLFWSYGTIWSFPWGNMSRCVIGNVILFIPFGLLLQNYFSKYLSVAKTTLLAFLCSAAIEMIQLAAQIGYFEFDDMFHNTLGAVIGAGAFWAVQQWKTEKKELKKQAWKPLLPGFLFAAVTIFVNSRPYLEFIF